MNNKTINASGNFMRAAKSTLAKPLLVSMLALFSATSYAGNCASTLNSNSANQPVQQLTAVKLKIDHIKGDSVECVYGSLAKQQVPTATEIVPQDMSAWKKGSGAEFVCKPSDGDCTFETFTAGKSIRQLQDEVREAEARCGNLSNKCNGNQTLYNAVVTARRALSEKNAWCDGIPGIKPFECVA